MTKVYNRPGVDGVVLQTPLPLINFVIRSISAPVPPNVHNIITTMTFKLENCHFEKMFTQQQVSPVMCHLSRVPHHLSHVTCHMTPIFFIFVLLKKNLQSGGASR